MRTPLERTYRKHMAMQRLWRVGRALRRAHVPLLPGLVRGLCRALFAADLPMALHMPRDVVFMHNGLGAVVHPDTAFRGPALVFHHATLGNSKGLEDGAPTIGSRVLIGAGACVLGPVRIGDGCIVGANAVVTEDVPDGQMAAGNPARLRPANPATLDRIFGPAAR